MSSSTDDDELNIESEKFNPIKALYSKKLQLTEADKYENLGIFMSRLKAAGNKLDADLTSFRQTKKQKQVEELIKNDVDEKYHKTAGGRVFLKEQAPIKGKKRTKDTRNVLTRIDQDQKGPISLLQKFFREQTRVRIYVRKEHGIRGYVTGFIEVYDKHPNIVLSDCIEVWNRRKYDYSDNKTCLGKPQDCSRILEHMGFVIPIVNVKSISRKIVKCERTIPKMMIRGEDVVLICKDYEDTEVR